MWGRMKAGAVAGLVSLALVAPAVPAVASPIGSGPVCDRELTQICLSVDGNSGSYVYGKTYSNDNEEDTTVAAANVCGGTDVVDGAGTTCPFSEGSGHLNNKYARDNALVVYMYNGAENGEYYLGRNTTGMIVQGSSAGTGYLWVLDPVSSGSNIYYLVNVAVSSDNQAPWFACSQGANQPVLLSEAFLGGGACEWVFT